MSQAPPVRILPDALINKIAAGEVVERPASVVKELVENAVDAGAKHIRVEIRNGGKSLVAVSDDGRGMGRDDALTAIERHATSKIRHPDDLFNIATLGFRGEALPSIAQISRMEIMTAREGDAAGTQLVLHDGVLKQVRDAPAVPGTEVRVRRLFVNIPVRLRFLKGERTEVGHCVEAVTRVALANPSIGFELVKGDSFLIRAAPTDDLRRRTIELLGRSVGDDLLDVDRTEDGMRVWGLASRPALNRSSRNALYVFVNGRPVRDRLALGAILGAYRSLVPRGRYPIVVLFLEVAVDRVDHNVHPTKNEVRFVRGHEVFRFLSATLEQVLATTRADPAARPQVGELVRTAGAGPVQAPLPTSAGEGGRPSPSWSVVRDALFDDPSAIAPTPAAAGGLVAPREPADGPAAVRGDASDGRAPEQASPSQLEAFRFVDLDLIGVYEGTYVVLQHGEDLVLLDQHAAHERINYERLLRTRGEAGPSQRLLVPEVLDLPRSQTELLLGREQMLASLGIEIGDFGGGSIAVTGVPPWLGPGQARRLIEDVAQELLTSRPGTAIEDLRHRVAALAACHASVRAHDRLTPEAIRSLLVRLDGAGHPFTCPHGRPILVRFTRSDVKKWFERT